MAASSVIIVAGGSGKRMGGGVKKEFLEIEGVPVLFRAVKPFIETSLFNSVVIAVNGSLVEKTHEILNPFLTPEEREMIRCIPGGSTRRESVFRGLQALKEQSPDIVLIHDGARPWITEGVIAAVYNKALKKGAAIPVVPSVNALKKIDPEGKIIESIDRETVVGAQTPQGFDFKAILSAHILADRSGRDFPDDAEVFSEFVSAVYTVPGDIHNRKITYMEDIEEKT